MNIVYFLLNQFFNEESLNITLIIATSFIINIFQTNGISYISATMIDSIQKNDKVNVNLFFKYFILF